MNDYFDEEDNEPGAPRQVKAEKPLIRLPELLEGQVWSCSLCGGDSCKAVLRENDYQVSYDPATGETIRLSESVYVSDCCTGDLTLLSDASIDADPVEIPADCYAPITIANAATAAPTTPEIPLSPTEKFAGAKTDHDRFDLIMDELKQFANEGAAADLSADAVKLLVSMTELYGLKYCELVTSHNNAVVAMGSALIELQNNNPDAAQEWLENTCDNSEGHGWQLFTNAQEYYDHMALPWPLTAEEHRENVVVSNARHKELDARMSEQREKSFNPKAD